jgi:hypothetical protein
MDASRSATVTTVATVNQRFSTNIWYRVEVQWGTNGTVVGNVYGSSGTQLINSLRAASGALNTSIVSGGIGIRTTGAGTTFWDTVTDKFAANQWLAPDRIQRAPIVHGHHRHHGEPDNGEQTEPDEM